MHNGGGDAQKWAPSHPTTRPIHTNYASHTYKELPVDTALALQAPDAHNAAHNALGGGVGQAPLGTDEDDEGGGQLRGKPPRRRQAGHLSAHGARDVVAIRGQTCGVYSSGVWCVSKCVGEIPLFPPPIW